MAGRKTRTCSLCKKEVIKYLSSHLRYKHKMMSAETRAPYLKASRNTTIKNVYTVLNSTVEDGVLAEFYEKKRFIEQEFQDIEDRIVDFYLKIKPATCPSVSIREETQKQLMLLYKLVIRPIENLVYETTVQLKNDPSDVETISKVNHSAGEGKVMEESTNIE